jgi:hypothetical protein
MTLILIAIQSLWGPQNQETALAAFQMVSVCSGATASLVSWARSLTV